MPKTIRVVLGGSEGRMGQVLQGLISQRDDMEIVCAFDLLTADSTNISDILREPRIASAADVYVDFTHPDAVVDNVTRASEAGIDSVIGTSGWYDRLEEVRGIAVTHGRRILYSPNFSPGVNVLFYAAHEIGKLLEPFGYDVAIREIHHTGKVDAPSGTAITLGHLLLKGTKKETLAYERRGQRKPSEIDVVGVRVGKVAGHHEVWFTPHESYAERLILQHDVFTPEVFGIGALRGVQWIIQAQKEGKPAGLYDFYEAVLGLTPI